MEEKSYRVPYIVWLRVTDYMHGWMQYELGSCARVGEQKVVCVQHLPGAREVLRMETNNDLDRKGRIDKTMSAARMNCVKAGLKMDAEVIERDYGLTSETLKLFVPVECPDMKMTERGVLRPWTLDTCLGRRQANELMQVLRDAFWKAVSAFNEEYAKSMCGEKYPTIDMVEAFCKLTNTSDVYAEAIKREWNRRVKRSSSPSPTPGLSPGPSPEGGGNLKEDL